NLGLYTQRGEIGVFFIPSQVGTAAITSPGIVGQVFVLDDYARRLQSNQSLIARGQSAPLISMETALGTGGEGPKYLTVSGPGGDVLAPVPIELIYTLQTRYAQPT